MAQKCAICGAEINVFQSQKLTDGNFICRKKCKKLGMKYFDYVHADLRTVLEHNKQVEVGTKIFNDLFVPRMKTKDKTKKLKKFNSHLFVSQDLGLMALAEPKYKFWIFGKYWPKACVFRTGDLYTYDEEKATRMVDGKPETDTFMRFSFVNTPGLCEFLDKCDSDKDVVKYFNGVFGIEKSLKNIGNTWKNQINAVKASTAAMKAAFKGEADAAEKAAGAKVALDVMQFGDRTEINAKADAVLSKYNV